MRHVVDVPERIAQAVAERVVALVVDALDVNALLARVDVDELLDRIDVDALLARVDVADLVDQVDVDDLLARVDVEALVARIDLASTMAATAGSAAGDTLAVVRRTARRADDVVASWVDHLPGPLRPGASR